MFRRLGKERLVIDRLRKDVYFVDRRTWQELRTGTRLPPGVDRDLSELQRCDRRALTRTETKRARSHSYRAIDKALRAYCAPLFSTVETTQACNLRCAHCYHGDALGRVRSDLLTTSELKNLLDELERIGTVSVILTGGEFLLRRDYQAILAHAGQKDFLTTVFTNGIALTADALDSLEASQVDGIQVSLYGNDTLDAEYVSNRAFRTAWNHLLQAQRRSLALSVVLTPTVDNWLFLESVSVALTDRCIPFSYNIDLHPTKAGSVENAKLGVLGDVNAFRRVQQLAGIPSSSREHAPSERPCDAGFNVFHVTCTGDVTPCVCWPEPLGNIRTQSLGAIWATSRLHSIRALTRADFAGCSGCSLEPWCLVCPGNNYATQRSATAPSAWSCRCALTRRLGDAEPGILPETNTEGDGEA